MRKLEISKTEVTTGGSWQCEYTLSGLFAFGGGALLTPGLQIVGGVAVVLALGLQAGGACGY